MKFYSFWAINAPLNTRQLSSQLQQLRNAGFDGVVFQPRFYQPPPAYLSPEWMDIIGQVIKEHPESDFYIQDENGWPAPSVDGELLRRYPSLRQQYISAYPVGKVPENVEIVTKDAKTVYVKEYSTYADTLNRETAERFASMTYERYLALSPLFGKPFYGFFCDEPQFAPFEVRSPAPMGMIPWTKDLPEVYSERFGEDLISKLPALFYNRPDSEQVRRQFYELSADLFRERFVEPLAAWCKEHGIRWTGHFKGEEHPYFQVLLCGPCSPLYRSMNGVGIDILERHPGERYFLREAATVIRQDGLPGLVECCGGGGWGMKPEDLYMYFSWLILHGINEFVLHQAQYRFTPLAIHDWPPSTPFHQPYAECFPSIFERLRQELKTMQVSKAYHPILVIAPYRGIMQSIHPAEIQSMDIHKASWYADSPAGLLNKRFLDLVHLLDSALLGYDVMSERDFETYVKIKNGLQVGACKYECILITEGCILTTVAEEIIREAKKIGIHIFDLREKKDFSRVPAHLAENLRFPVNTVKHPMPLSIAGELVIDKEGSWLGLVNADIYNPVSAVFTVLDGKFLEGAEWTEEGQKLKLLPGEIRIVPLVDKPKALLPVKSLVWDYRIEILDDNVLVLDDWQMDKTLPYRGIDKVYPVDNNLATAKVMCKEKITSAYLVSLAPLKAISINNETTDAKPVGYFRYPELLTYKLPAAVSRGENTLSVELNSPWKEPIPFRLWLGGKFLVKTSTPWEEGPNNTLRSAGPFTLCEIGKENPDGEKIVQSGYPFYTGTLRYSGVLHIKKEDEASSLSLDSVAGASAHVWLDGEDLGWTWGPRWEVRIGRNIPAGNHKLTVELGTTSFNLFGPHHHVSGDPLVVTTSHWTGKRDFAQPPDGLIIVKETHVQPTGLGRVINLEYVYAD